MFLYFKSPIGREIPEMISNGGIFDILALHVEECVEILGFSTLPIKSQHFLLYIYL